MPTATTAAVNRSIYRTDPFVVLANSSADTSVVFANKSADVSVVFANKSAEVCVVFASSSAETCVVFESNTLISSCSWGIFITLYSRSRDQNITTKKPIK